MDFQLPEDAAGLNWSKGLVQGGGCMRIEVVHDQDDLLGFGIVNIDQLSHEVRPVLAGALLGHIHVALACQRFAGQEELAHLALFIGIIVARGVSWLHGQSFQLVCMQLLARFVHTDLGKAGIIGPGVDFQDVFESFRQSVRWLRAGCTSIASATV